MKKPERQLNLLVNLHAIAADELAWFRAHKMTPRNNWMARSWQRSVREYDKAITRKMASLI